MKKISAADVFVSALLILLAAWIVSPAVYVLFRSFGDGFSGYVDFYLRKPRFLQGFCNSLLIALGVSVGSTIVSVFASFVFAKVSFRGKSILFFLYIAMMLMPFQVTMLPSYLVSKKLGVYDTLFSLILPGIFAPFSVFLLTQIMKSIPDEIIEAARLETDSFRQILFSIILPSVRPGILCTAVLTFTEYWNAVAEPMVLMETEEHFPLALLLDCASVTDAYGFAAAALFLLAPFLLFLYFEREITEGLGGYQLK